MVAYKMVAEFIWTFDWTIGSWWCFGWEVGVHVHDE